MTIQRASLMCSTLDPGTDQVESGFENMFHSGAQLVDCGCYPHAEAFCMADILQIPDYGRHCVDYLHGGQHCSLGPVLVMRVLLQQSPEGEIVGNCSGSAAS